ncbi:MAG: SDR family NAD(P)-dependent oxidoreductase [Opitutaceae bacterium]|nr:SDR family NAD(P)-dependent oxidoreductase [Opitutaceae bacterium]
MSAWCSNAPPKVSSSACLLSLYRTAFVTGTSTGLGRVFAEMLLAEGVHVWGTARSVARLQSLAAHPHFHAVELDLKNGEAAERAFTESAAQAGGFDLVINNAGYGVFGDFAATDFAVWREQLEVMLIYTARLNHAALRGMRARGTPGALVNISSLAAEFPLPFQSAYNIAKAGLTALNESLMIETAGTPIVILDVRPGDYRTDFESSVLRPSGADTPAMTRAWQAFVRMMRSGPAPEHAARALRRALLKRRSGTVRCGRIFQAVIAPFLSRFGSLRLKRRVQARYFDL